jgi:hypothetical protein
MCLLVDWLKASRHFGPDSALRALGFSSAVRTGVQIPERSEKPTWGQEHIANELKLKLGIRVSPRTVGKYLRE